MIALACDHGGYDLKEQVKSWLAGWNEEVLDLGCNGPESVDYPDYAKLLAESIQQKKADKGILICGTGIGMSIAVNKFDGIRGALVHDNFTARMSRLHNDSNVLVLGGRVLGLEVAKDIVKTWLDTPFEGDRHQRRLNIIHGFE